MTQIAPHQPPSPEVVIVAHGAPSDPDPQEAAVQTLAARVQALLPGARIQGATLAKPGALETALSACHAPSVYPFFMAQGWFTGTVIPRRLEAAGHPGAPVLTPYGRDPEMPGLLGSAAIGAAAAAGFAPAEATLLLAAHGSAVSRGSARATGELVEKLSRGPFARVVAGFIEEPPHIAEVARSIEGPALCLPLFALTASHVIEDIPEALDEAGFAGPLLPAVGSHAGTPALIAAAITRAQQRAAA